MVRIAIRRASAVALACGLLQSAAVLPAGAQDVAPPFPVAAYETPVLAREVSLADLGRGDGVTLRGFEGETRFAAPVPTAAVPAGSELVLVLERALPDGMRAALTVEIGGRARMAQQLPPGSATDTLRFPLDAQDLATPHLVAIVRFGGALTENRCFDQRFEGATLRLRPESRVRFVVDPGRLTTVAAAASALPADPAIVLPQAPVTAEVYAAAAAVAGALVRTGHRPRFAAAGDIVIDAGAAGISLRAATPRPLIVVGPDAPAHVIAATFGAAVQPSADTIAFAVEAGTYGARAMGAAEEWTVPLSWADLPPARRPQRADIAIGAGLDPNGRSFTAHLLLGNTLLASQSYARPDGSLRLSVPLPRDLPYGSRLTLRLERQQLEQDCLTVPPPLPVELQPASSLVLASLGTPQAFRELAPAAAGGAAVYLPASVLADPAASLPFTASLLGRLFSPATTAFVFVAAGQGIGIDRPFAVLGLPLPAESLIAGAPTADGMIDAGGRTVAVGGRISAHLATAAGQPGLWVSAVSGLPSDALLDGGAAALIGADGRIETLSVAAPGASAEVQAVPLWMDYRLWSLVAGALLVASVLVWFARRWGDDDSY